MMYLDEEEMKPEPPATRENPDPKKKQSALQSKVEELQAQLGDCCKERDEALAQLAQMKGLDDIPTPKATFRIDMYEQEGHHQGRISHLQSKNQKTLVGVDGRAIVDFICGHLPRIIQRKPIIADQRAKRQPDPPSLRDVRFRQGNSIVDLGSSLRAGIPFSVKIHLHLPVVPNPSNMDLDTPDYAIRVVASDESGEKQIAKGGFTGVLGNGVVDYCNDIQMPGLGVGKHKLTVFAIARLGQVMERRAVMMEFQKS